MKKVLAILTAAAAVVGSTLSALPADAVTADLPVEVKVEPYIYLRTYKSLKFVVTQSDLQGKSTDDPATTIDYNEANPLPLNPDAPNPDTVLGTTKTVSKTVNPLFLLWGAPNTAVNITVNPTGPDLKGTGTFATTAKMSVKTGGTATATLSPNASYKGSVALDFVFDAVPSAGTYTGGKLTISATTP